MVTADHLMIDRRILQEAGTLIAQGFEVTLLAGFECAKAETFLHDGLTVHRFVYDWSDSRFAPWARRLGLRPGTKLNALAWRSWRHVMDRWGFSSFEQFVLDRMQEHEADLLHVHDFPMLRAGVKFARTRNIPLVYDAHELYYAQTQLPPETQRRYRSRERRWIRYADVSITVNPYIARLMAQRYGIRAPEVILNAAPMQARTDDKPFHQRFGLESDVRIVLYQGWISDNRGIDRLVLAARDFAPGIALVIVGYGAYEEAMRRLVDDHSLQDRVHFYGGVDSSVLHPLTCGADLGVIPYFGVDDNNYYCSPNKLFEFAIAELPFLCNDLPFLRDIIDRYSNGITADLTDPAGIARVVNDVLGDAARVEALQAGARAAKQELNWDVEARKLLCIYDSVAV